MLRSLLLSLRGLPVLIGLLSTPVFANHCFNIADTYYQQIYCELKASGNGKGLPGFGDFRRNNEQMQALLLKPYARKAGIALEMPGKKQSVIAVKKKPEKSVVETSHAQACVAENLDLQCQDRRYSLVVNQPNEALRPGVLSPAFHMALPEYQGKPDDSLAIQQYLLVSYKHYLRRMMAIGLGGSTLSYAKFAFLFEDLAGRGMSFRDRFEVMFRYLKADKKKLRAPVLTALPAEFDVENCFPLSDLMVCQAGYTNLVFRNR